MRVVLALAAGWALSSTVGAQTRAPELTPNDFARGITLDVTDDAPIHELPVPLAVYEIVVRADLGDLRVFNAAGEAVPHRLSRPPERQRSEAAVDEARFFALSSEKAARPGELRLELERFDGTARIDLERAVPPSSPETTFYLVDAGDEEPPARTLHLEWRAVEETFLVDVRLESSDDLADWSRHDGRATLAELRRGAETIVRNEVPAGDTTRRYLRLVSTSGRFPFELTRVEIERSPVTTETEPIWVDVATVETPDDDPDAGWLFTSPGAVPVSYVRVRPRADNALSDVRILARADDDVAATGWRQRGAGRVYRLRVGDGRIESTEVAVSPTSAERRWKIAVERRGLGYDPPEIAVGYRPHTLAFLARGEGPFLLAYGSARATAASEVSFRDLSERERGDVPVSREVGLGPPRELAGPQALVPVTELDWGRWALWSVLVLAAAVLLGMARSLWKQMNPPGDPENGSTTSA